MMMILFHHHFLGNREMRDATKYESKAFAAMKQRSLIRSELNLEKNAVFTVSTYKKKSREVSVEARGSNGKIAKRVMVVGRTAEGVETGVLTTTHFKVYLALVELWERAGKPINDPVHFTVYKVIKRLGLQDDGRTYGIIKRKLYGLRQIPIEFIDSFYTKDDDFRSLRPFSILGYLDIYERKDIGKRKKIRGYGEFQFDRHILESLLSNHVHPLRLDIISSFRKHKDLAVLIYTYIDRSIAFKSHFEIRLKNLFRNLDLSQRHVKYPSDRKRVIDPVLDQIRGRELSTGVLSDIDIVRTVDGDDYKLVCRKKSFTKRLKEQEEPSQPQLELALSGKTGLFGAELEHTGSDSGLRSRLTAKGLTKKQAAKLILESPDAINDQLAYLPFRIDEYKAQGKEINAAAILYDSISDNWQAPKGYLGAEQEKEREAERLEQKRISRLEREERYRVEQERLEIEAYKETLTSEKRAKLRERALAELRSTEGVKEQFIGEPLITSKENEILRSTVGEYEG